MKRFAILLTTAVVALAPMSAADAKDNGKGKGKALGHGIVHNGGGATANCPPGLAKKDPPCVPPGLAKKDVHGDDRHEHDDDHVHLEDHVHRHQHADGQIHAHEHAHTGAHDHAHVDLGDADVVVYRPGDLIETDYILVHDPEFYGLDPIYDYYRVGDRFYRVDGETQEVIAFVGALADLLN